MYSTITMPCSDGSDPGCKGEIDHDLEYIGLTFDQIETIVSQEGLTIIELSPKQMKVNNLTKDDVEYCNVEKRAWIDIDVSTTCCFCGSNDKASQMPFRRNQSNVRLNVTLPSQN